MGRTCANCGNWCSNSKFSRNQWVKGEGCSRCRDCIDGRSYRAPAPAPAPTYSYQCQECYREFSSQNELNMHMQVHRPRNVACPVCGDTRFRSGANAVQHVESGFCTGCLGQDNARNQIYKYASSKRAMGGYLHNVPMLTNGSHDSQVPDLPYHCPDCAKSFRQLSQLLQHQDQKHNRQRLLGY